MLLNADRSILCLKKRPTWYFQILTDFQILSLAHSVEDFAVVICEYPTTP